MMMLAPDCISFFDRLVFSSRCLPFYFSPQLSLSVASRMGEIAVFNQRQFFIFRSFFPFHFSLYEL